MPVTISVFNEATALPFTKFLTSPLHPGIEMGAGFTYSERKHRHFFQTFNVGYFFHQHLYHGFFVKAQLNYDVKLSFGLNFKTVSGIGYLHTFSTQKTHIFKEGNYQAGQDKGNSRVMFSLGSGLGYRLQRRNPYSPELFVLYQGWLEYPFSPGFIPLMTHTNLQVGTKIFYNKK